MLIAGEASGDTLAAELVKALKPTLAEYESQPTADLQPLHASLQPSFFGAGGPKMAAAVVELAFDLTVHAVVGVAEVLKNYGKFRRFFFQLWELALKRQPDVIILIDYPGFNLRFAKLVKNYVRSRQGPFVNWNPKIVCYVSPQLWAWHESRVYQIARDVDLMLSIFPFEKEWYARRARKLRVEYVGHPLVDRYGSARRGGASTSAFPALVPSPIFHSPSSLPLVLILPGSRAKELKNHLPAIIDAVNRIAAVRSIRLQMVLPTDELVRQVKDSISTLPDLEVTSIGLERALGEAEVAIASSGTVTMECAYFGVPTVVIYKTSWSTYWLGKQFIRVKFLAMPNLLANEQIYPELIQGEVTAEKIANEALSLITDRPRRIEIQAKLAKVIESLGPPGASQRAAQAILGLLTEPGEHGDTLRRAARVHPVEVSV